MIFAWMWLWLVFLFVFLLMPVGYGWGYRRWGPPYPRYVQRRRGERASQRADNAPYDHYAWGWGGDIFWILLVIWVIWLFVGFWPR